MAYKCKIFEAVSITLHGHYMHVYSLQFIGVHTENRMSAKQGMDKCSLMLKKKYDCQIYSIDAYYC